MPVSSLLQPWIMAKTGQYSKEMKKILPLCQKLVWMTYSQLFLASNRGEVGHDLALRRIVRHPKMWWFLAPGIIWLIVSGEVCSGTCAFRSTQLNDSRCASNVESSSGFTQSALHSYWAPGSRCLHQVNISLCLFVLRGKLHIGTPRSAWGGMLDMFLLELMERFLAQLQPH